MARILVATVPLTGHVEPMRLVVRALVARGHEVRWAAATKFAARIAETGATYLPPDEAPDWDDGDVDTALPVLHGRTGLARIKAELRAMFIFPMGAQLRDLEAAAVTVAPDAILADQAHLGAALFAERHRIPWVSLGVSALGIPSVDTAPFGPGWPRPARGVVGRVRTRVLYAMVHGLMFGSVTRAYRRARVAAGFAAGTRSYFDFLGPDVHLQPTVPSFEYPRSDLPPQVRFIGPLVPPAPAAVVLPEWWPDLLAAHARGTPIVLVTQGTLATDPTALIVPTLAALADEDVFTVATSGRPLATPPPPNARVAAFVPYAALLPLVRVMVTNAGYGGVQMALQHGVPLVAAGGTEEKPEIAARIAWCGAGVDLRTGTPAPAAIRVAVRRVLSTPGYRDRAAALAAEMADFDAPVCAATTIEGVIAQLRDRL